MLTPLKTGASTVVCQSRGRNPQTKMRQKERKKSDCPRRLAKVLPRPFPLFRLYGRQANRRSDRMSGRRSKQPLFHEPSKTMGAAKPPSCSLSRSLACGRNSEQNPREFLEDGSRAFVCLPLAEARRLPPPSPSTPRAAFVVSLN